MLKDIITYIESLKPTGFWGYIGVFTVLYTLITSLFFMKRHINLATADMQRKINKLKRCSTLSGESFIFSFYKIEKIKKIKVSLLKRYLYLLIK